MEILDPVNELTEVLKTLAPKQDQESGQPQELNDNASALAKALGRQRVTYDPVWLAVEKAAGRWVPVRCNSYRRALLLASSAMQHRTMALEVWRRGRLVCVRLIKQAPLRVVNA
jgi:hypothetical protein